MLVPKSFSVSSREDILNIKEEILDSFLSDGILVISDFKFEYADQDWLIRELGDDLGWWPNNSHETKVDFYTCNHEQEVTWDRRPDEVFLPWHMEHVEYVNPIWAGIWNMHTFSAAHGSGMTYFMDGRSIYNSLSKDWQEFLDKSVVCWDQFDGTGPFVTPAVERHFYTKEPVIRLDVDVSRPFPTYLYTYEGREPSVDEALLFLRIMTEVENIVYNSTDLRIVQKWKQNDVIIADIFRMYHAVTGGFYKGEREFSGFFTRRHEISPDSNELKTLGLAES